MTSSQFSSAQTVNNTAACFFAISSVRKNADAGKYDNNIKTPNLASLCGDVLPQYATAAQQYQTETLATIEQRRRGTPSDATDSAASQDCLSTKYVPNDSCQTSDAVAIQIVNNCHRAVHVQACIATNGPEPARGGYHINDGAALTHYTCHGLMRFSVNEIP